MFWFWLAGSIVLIGALWMAWIEREPAAFPVVVFFGSIIGFVAALVINLMFTLIISTSLTPGDTSPLLALRDSTSAEGSFFLGTGSVDEEASFFYYEQLDHGARLAHVDADNAIIVEEDIDEPYVQVMEETSSSNFWMAEWLTDGRSYEFHIPEGSIITNYSLDAE